MVDVSVTPERRTAASRRRLVVPILATLLVLSLLALFLYGLNTDRLPTGVAPRSNTMAPDFQLTTLTGQSVKLSDLRGKVVVLNFWASWCVPCKDEQPALDALAKTYNGRGVAFVGINIQDNQRDANGFVQQFGITYPVASDPSGAVYINYGVVGVPETYVVTRDGRIGRKLVGPVDPIDLSTTLEEQLR